MDPISSTQLDYLLKAVASGLPTAGSAPAPMVADEDSSCKRKRADDSSSSSKNPAGRFAVDMLIKKLVDIKDVNERMIMNHRSKNTTNYRVREDIVRFMDKVIAEAGDRFGQYGAAESIAEHS